MAFKFHYFRIYIKTFLLGPTARHHPLGPNARHPPNSGPLFTNLAYAPAVDKWKFQNAYIIPPNI